MIALLVVLLPIVRCISDVVVKCSCTGILSVCLGGCRLACPSTIHGRSSLLTQAKMLSTTSEKYFAHVLTALTSGHMHFHAINCYVIKLI